MATEIAVKQGVRINKNLFFQFLDYYLGDVSGCPGVSNVTKWVKMYDSTFNNTERQSYANDGDG